jgi:hypothetical protein
VGAYLNDPAGIGNAGSAYIFKRQASSWTEQAKLTISDGEPNDLFGVAISMNSNQAIVAAIGDDDMGSFSGSAYLFKNLPFDNFDDNTRGAMWRLFEDDPEKTWLVEDVNRLNVRAVSNINLTSVVGYWKMDDDAANTTVADSSGNANDGTAQQNTTVLHTTGKINGALTFNGTSDYVDVGNVIGTEAYTKIAWIKRADTASFNNIISGDTDTHAFWAPSSGSFTLRAGHNGTWNLVEDSESLNPDIWYHVAVTYDPDVDSGTMLLYKDGTPVDSATGVSSPLPSSTTYIGRYSSGYYFSGSIDNVMILDEALTSDEIEFLYNEEIGDLATSCIGHWKLNDDAADTWVIDSSGNGSHGIAQQNTSILHTTGKIDGAFTFNGTSNFVNVGNVIGSEAYTKAAWVKREDAVAHNNIISGNTAHAFWAPGSYSFKLSAGHNNSWDIVQDSESLDPNVWYHVAVTFDPNEESGTMVLYKDGIPIDSNTSVSSPLPSSTTYIGKYSFDYYFNGSIDNVMIFNKALTTDEIESLYNEGSGTETLPGGTPDSNLALYVSNGWRFDANESFAVKADFHYSDIDLREGWVGITVENDNNHVSISAGSDSGQRYFYYESVVDGNTVFEREPRDSNDGTLYISYDANSNNLYLSHVAYGSENAYVWQTTPDPLQGQWEAQPVDVTIGGGSKCVGLGTGEAYLDNFEVTTATITNGFEADLDSDGDVDFEDFVIFAAAWQSEFGDGNWNQVCDISEASENAVDTFDLGAFAKQWLYFAAID